MLGEEKNGEILGSPSGLSHGWVLSTSVEAVAEQDQNGGDRHESHHHGEQQDFFSLYLTIYIRYFIR